MFSRRHAGLLFLFWLGSSVVICQTLFLRELLNLFSGNEFSLGIMLSVWLLASALGAAWGDRLSRSVFLVDFCLAGVCLLALLLPLFPIISQAYRTLSGLPPELSLSPGQVMLASLLLLSLPAFLHGLLFPLACSTCSNPLHQQDESSGQGYAVESLGSLAGGVLAVFLLLPQIRTVPALVGLALAGMGVVALMVYSSSNAEDGRSRKLVIVSLVTAGLMAAYFSGRLTLLEQRAIATAYPYATVLQNSSTRYQKLTLLAMNGQHTLMAGGRPLVTLPHPDDGSAEAMALIPLMAADRPNSVLVMGGLESLPRLVTTIPQVQRIDCLEADPGLFDALNLVPDAKQQLGLNDSRVRLVKEDARAWLAKAPERYDVVLVSLPAPTTLAMNRFYSMEFYRQISRLMTDDAIMVIALPGSETYLTPSLAGLLATVSRAAQESFSVTLAVPGGNTLLLASRPPLEVRLRPALLTARMNALGVRTLLVTTTYLEDRLAPERLAWLRGELARTDVPANRDSAPLGARYGLAFQMEQQGSVAAWWSGFLSQRIVLPLAGLLLIATALPGLVTRGSRRATRLGALASTGFTAMTLELLLMLAYQSHTGLIYQGVALFTSVFMAGIALGVELARRCDERYGTEQMILTAEAGQLLLAGLLGILFLSGSGLIPVFAMLTGVLLAGVMTGMEFRAVTGISDGKKGERPGQAYAADLLGACLGGLLAGMVLIPLAGFGATCVILATIKVLQMVMLIRSHPISS